jgi:ArsR family transcriptional regulator, arsenate/arsenite/antimonite-responsive transcriptional repressor / arsenate reductase (thioredoxin)
MKKAVAIGALSALAQETRLDIFRVLVRAGLEGIAAGVLSERLGLVAPNLSFHLNQLRHAGLVWSRREGRSIIYAANFDAMNGLVAYLTENCCEEQTQAPNAAGRQPGPTADRELNVLFLCTRNSARSVMAECALNRWGKGKFRGFSAGSHPSKNVHPTALQVLEGLRYETGELRGKSWNEFARRGAPKLDFVFTLCDRAAAEVCPTWPGQPITAHWGVIDPVTFAGIGDAKRRLFLRVYKELEHRIKIFTSLPLDTLERFAVERRVKEIGQLKLPDEGTHWDG